MSRRVRHIDPSIGWTASSARAKVEAGAEGGQRRSVEKATTKDNTGHLVMIKAMRTLISKRQEVTHS